MIEELELSNVPENSEAGSAWSRLNKSGLFTSASRRETQSTLKAGVPGDEDIGTAVSQIQEGEVWSNSRSLPDAIETNHRPKFDLRS